MKRIIIIGCPGSGKTTLSYTISKRLGVPLYHLDHLKWLPGWQAVSREEFELKQNKILETDAWVIDGNFTKSIPMRMAKADTVIFMDIPRYVCLWRLFKRYIYFFGKARPDMGGDNKEQLQLEFLKFVLTYPRSTIYEMLKDFPADKRLYIIKDNKDLNKFLAHI